jgi:hypothetical protein
VVVQEVEVPVTKVAVSEVVKEVVKEVPVEVPVVKQVPVEVVVVKETVREVVRDVPVDKIVTVEKVPHNPPPYLHLSHIDSHGSRQRLSI